MLFYNDPDLKGNQNNNKPLVRVMVFNTTFNNILAISWQSAVMVEETGVPGENH